MDSILQKLCFDFFKDCKPLCDEESERSEVARKELCDALTKEQKLLFDKFDSLNETFYCAHEDEVFRRAFQMGFKLAMEILKD